MSFRSTWAAALFLALGLCAQVYGQAEFVRLQKGNTADDAALQTAYAVYRSANSDVEIVLYGVVHIAEESYYQTVQRHLDGYDVVLFEGVSPTAGLEPDESMKTIGKLQMVMAELLDLQFQKDGIDYSRKNLVHADMTQEELLKAAGGDLSKIFPMGGLLDNPQLKSILPMLEMGAGFMKSMMDSNPKMRDSLKRQLADQLSQFGDSGPMAPGGEVQRVLIVERNKVAMKVLEKELAKRDSGSICIFYGAAHMQDFEERLAALGFHRAEHRWVSAWNMGDGVPEEKELAPAAPRTEWF